MALLYELRSGVIRSDLVDRGHVVEVGVLYERIESVMGDRAIGVAEDGFGEAAVEDFALRTVAHGMIEFREQAAVFMDLILQIVPEEPSRSLGLRTVGLLGLVEDILDTGRDLESVKLEPYANAAGPARGFGAGLSVAVFSVFPVYVDVPTIRWGVLNAH